jgi:predicted nucleic acid-binding Zn ribbon protein
MDEPRSLSDALRRVRRDLGAPEPGALERLRRRWPELVGPALAAHSEPAGVREGRLRVVVDDPAWGGQFRYLHDALVTAVSEAFPDLAIREVSVTASPSDGRPGATGRDTREGFET